MSQHILTALGLDLKFSENAIIGRVISHEGCSAPMADVRNYVFTSITDKTV